jgi:hypothetical protein
MTTEQPIDSRLQNPEATREIDRAEIQIDKAGYCDVQLIGLTLIITHLGSKKELYNGQVTLVNGKIAYDISFTYGNDNVIVDKGKLNKELKLLD